MYFRAYLATFNNVLLQLKTLHQAIVVGYELTFSAKALFVALLGSYADRVKSSWLDLLVEQGNSFVILTTCYIHFLFHIEKVGDLSQYSEAFVIKVWLLRF